jgi:hypothetical protein
MVQAQRVPAAGMLPAAPVADESAAAPLETPTDIEVGHHD